MCNVHTLQTNILEVNTQKMTQKSIYTIFIEIFQN